MMIFFGIYGILTTLCIMHIMLYGSRPTKSLSWLLIVLIFPFLGILLYMIFGMNRRRIKIFKLKQTIRRRLYAQKHKEDTKRAQTVPFPQTKHTRLEQLMYASSHFSAIPDNHVQVLQSGKATFTTIFELLENATHFIHMQYYILEAGELCDRLLEIFTRKRTEGVEIRVLYDAIGSFALSKKIIQAFKAIGVEMLPIMPFRFGSFIFTLNYRNHRKILIVDGNKGCTGGVNFSDKYINATPTLGIWDDTHLYMEGPIIDNLHRVFIKDYYFASDGIELLTPKYLPKIKATGATTVQIVSGGPDGGQPSIMQQYIAMINLATTSIYISNPYFIPNSAMLEALRMAALSGVHIKLLVPKKSDSWLAKYSVLSFFEELLSLGVVIYQQKEDFLHSKIIIIDDEIASVGSGNFDHRSFEHNFETNVLLYADDIAKQMSLDFIQDCEQSITLTYEQHKKRPFKNKLLEGVARFFSPLL